MTGESPKLFGHVMYAKGIPPIILPLFCKLKVMGNSLPFFKRSNRRANEEPWDKLWDKPSSVEAAASVTPRAAAGPTHRRLDQDQHSQTATTSRPTNVTVASVSESKDQGETKTLVSAELSQVPLCVEANVSTVPVEGQLQASLTLSAAVGEGRGGNGAKITGHSTRTKRKHKTTTHRRQHGELTSITFPGSIFESIKLILLSYCSPPSPPPPPPQI